MNKNDNKKIGDNPIISVILPSLNVEQYICECLDSALNQTLANIELLCVDAGSTDGTLKILKEYEKKDHRVKVILSDQKSYGHQMNIGMDAAKGEYIAILETDDYIKPEMYETLYHYAKKYSLDVVKSDYEIFVGEENSRSFTYMKTCKKQGQYYRVINPATDLDIFNARMNTWTGIYRRQFLLDHNIRHNETPGASYQDNGFWFQTFLFAEKVYFIDRAFYQLRRDNPNSSVNNKGKIYCIFDEYSFIEKIVRENPEREKDFIYIFQKKKYDNCSYHYTRVGEEFKMDFLRRMSDEFKAARAAGELNPALFFGRGFDDLKEIMDNPESYYVHTVNNETYLTPEQELKRVKDELTTAKRDLANVHNSVSYKIGRTITFLPRKIRGGYYCLKENGIVYTIRHFFEKIGNAFHRRRK